MFDQGHLYRIKFSSDIISNNSTNSPIVIQRQFSTNELANKFHVFNSPSNDSYGCDINTRAALGTVGSAPGTEQKIFFPNLIAQKCQHIVIFNKSGLFMYQYDNQQESYHFQHYDPSFSAIKGWTGEHIKSVFFQDIDEDERQEMFFTGPHGMDILSFDVFSDQWKSILANFELNASERHSKMVAYMPKNPPMLNSSVLFASRKDELHWGYVEAVKIPQHLEKAVIVNKAINREQGELRQIPQITKLQSSNEKTVILLRDQLDCSSMMNSVNLNTGKVNFKLPLIDNTLVEGIKFDLNYNSIIQESEKMGLGWSFPENLILMDHQSSIYPELEKYYLIIQDNMNQLEFNKGDSTDTIHSFKISNDSSREWKIYYYKNEEKWEVKGPNIKLIYGLGNRIVWDIVWENWRGPGRSLKGQKRLATSWYLAEMHENESVINYTYDAFEEFIPGGKNFTSEIYLKSMTSQQTKINFEYSLKGNNEYEEPAIINQDGFIRSQMVQKRYLSRYTISTPNHHQDVNFIYDVIDKKRFLIGIKQQGDPVGKPLLQFGYEKVETLYLLRKANLPTGTRIVFNYGLVKRESVTDKEIDLLSYNVPKNHKVHFIGNEMFVSYINDQGKLNVKIFKKTTSLGSLFLGQGLITDYEIIPVQDIPTIICYTLSEIQVYFLQKEENTWIKKSQLVFSEDTMIRFGRDFIVVGNKNNPIEIISFDNNSKRYEMKRFITKVSSKPPLLLATYDNTFLAYDGHILWIAYEDFNQTWQSKEIKKMSRATESINKVLSLIDCEDKMKKTLNKYFTDAAIQMTGNLIILSRWIIFGAQLYTLIDILTLNNKYELINEKHFNVLQDDLNKVEIEHEDKEYTLKIGYKKHEGKFKLTVKEIRGPIIEELYKLHAPQEKIQEQKAKIIDQITKSLGKDFLLDPSKYVTTFNFPSLTCQNTTFTFDGNEWKERSLIIEKNDQKTSLLLDNKLILRKENSGDSIKLYKGNSERTLGSTLVNLETTNFDKIQNAYPIYIAYENHHRRTNVIKFYNDGDFRQVISLPSNEQLTFWSNYENLITSINNTNDQITLVFRPMLGLQYLLPDPVVTSTSTSFNTNETRIIGYEYSSPKVLGDVVHYEKASIIPDNKKSSFGWVEEIVDYDNSSRTRQMAYNAEGKLVRIPMNEVTKGTNLPKDDFEENYVNSTILDKSQKLKVAEFFVDNVTDDEVGYYGFEDYEINEVNSENSSKTPKKKWLFHQNDVVKNEFSLTGQNFLRLAKNPLQASFQPKNQLRDYVASCWIRPQDTQTDKIFEIPHLRANILTENGKKIYTRLSEIKYKFNDWYYIEVLIDFPFAKHVHNLQINSTNSQTFNQFRTFIWLSPGVNTTIDLDHIRFSPVNNYFNANIYDYKTNLIKSKIHANGLMKWYIYDQNQKEIATVDTTGHIINFQTYTKSSSVGKLTQLSSDTQISPEVGIYEDFSPYSFKQRWKIDNGYHWQISPNRLRHISMNQHNLELNLNEFGSDSLGLRMWLTLESDQSFVQFGNDVKFQRIGNTANFFVSNIKSPMPLQSEVIIIKERARIFVWIDGGLYYEGSSQHFSIKVIKFSNQITISDVLIFINPSLQITYKNSSNEKLQTIVLENDGTAIVTEYLYDELGRQNIVTKPARIKKTIGQPLLSYHSNFVTNKNPHSENSVWKIGKLQGECKETIEEYDYTETKYYKNPLNEKYAVGLPGKEFSVSGLHTRKFNSSCNSWYINDVYSIENNYTHQVILEPTGISHITVLDNKRNIVAKYDEIPTSEDLLTTYEYDGSGNLVKILPPLYHSQAQTLLKGSSSQRAAISKEKIKLQSLLGVHMTYDKKGNLISKKTPDSGKFEHMYDEDNSKILSIYYNKENKIENVIYYARDHLGRLLETGKVIILPSKDELGSLKLTKNNTLVYQQFHYSDNEREPFLRQNAERTITYNDGDPLIEESIYNADHQVLSKRIYIFIKDYPSPSLVSINKKYIGKKLVELEYPINVENHPFKITYKYNKHGQITSIGVPGRPHQFAKFDYNAAQQVIREQHVPHSLKNITRSYTYNSAGYVTVLRDEFLTEEVYYTENSYGGQGYGDGTVTAIKFRATWHQSCNHNELGLDEHSFITDKIDAEQSSLCFHALQEAGYLDSNNHQAKSYYPSLSQNLPSICSLGSKGRKIQSVLGEKGFPIYHGYTFDYGNHKELTKAKYFVGTEVPRPLQPDTFSKNISTVNSTVSHEIWKKLVDAGYIIPDNEKLNPFFSHSKAGKPFSNPTLINDLAEIDSTYKQFQEPLQKILASCFFQKCNSFLAQQNLHKNISKWVTNLNETETQRITSNIVQMLKKKQYFKKPFDKDFMNTLNTYGSRIPDIVRILVEYFEKQLGEGEFDVESYFIDPNGNHKNFYTGFDRYELSYRKNTNQVNTITYKSFSSNKPFEKFSVKHDCRGNVIQALHKGIQSIEYNQVSNRPVKIKLTNGNNLVFHYDKQGERILKKVIGKLGETISEIHYVRDEFGRTLVERKITYISPNLPPDLLITAYIYGPRGLIGFIRRDQFHSVIADHKGSTRLVVRAAEIVAAYDYLPYGNLMRKYGSDPEAHISYLFTGKEYDEETGLYNFHARLYDPNIGCFYQIDPKEQYPSPYKYAGNSPASMIDPDGKFAFLAVLVPVVLAIGSAYFHGAEANKNYNPLKWDWKSTSTYSAVVTGALTGALVGVAGVTLGPASLISAAKMAYWQTALENRNLNPLKWDWGTKTQLSLITGAISGYAPTLNYGKIRGGVGLALKRINKKWKKIKKLLPLLSESDPHTVAHKVMINYLKDRNLITISDIWQKTYSKMADKLESQEIRSKIGYATVFESMHKINTDFTNLHPHERIQATLRNSLKTSEHYPRSRNFFRNSTIKLHPKYNKHVTHFLSTLDLKKLNLPSSFGEIMHEIKEEKKPNSTITVKYPIYYTATSMNYFTSSLIIGNFRENEVKSGLPKDSILEKQLEQQFNELFVKEILPIFDSSFKQPFNKSSIFENLRENLFEKLRQDFKNSNNLVFALEKHIVEWAREKNACVSLSKLDSKCEELNVDKTQLDKFFIILREIIKTICENTDITNRMNQLTETMKRFNASTRWTSDNDVNEPKTLVALVKSHEGCEFENQKFAEISDIVYVSLYRVPNLERDQLMKTNRNGFLTFGVKNMITDIEWIDKIENANKAKQYNRIISSLPILEADRSTMDQLVNQRSYFSLPLDVVVPNCSQDRSNGSNKTNISLGRQKRSVSQTPSVIHRQNHSAMTSFTINTNQNQKIESTKNISSKFSRAFDWFSKFQIPFINEANPLPSKPESNSSINQIIAKIDPNSTLLLLNLLVRKITGKSPALQTVCEKSSPLEMQAEALVIVTEFEEILNESAKSLGLSLMDVNFDPVEVQNIIIDQLKRGRCSKIPEVLFSYIQEINVEILRDKTFSMNLRKNLGIIPSD